MSPGVLAELLAAPALPAPEGVTPDFDNPPNKNGLAWFVTTFCMVVATMCLFLRIIVRLWLEKKLRVEECKLTSIPLHLRAVEHIANSNSFQSWSFLHTYVVLSLLFPFCPTSHFSGRLLGHGLCRLRFDLYPWLLRAHLESS